MRTSSMFYGRMIRTLPAMGLLACLVSACASVLGDPEPALNIYDLSANSQTRSQSLQRQAVNILIDEPEVSRVLDHERILVRLSTNELRYLPSSRWSDRVPRLFQLTLIEAFNRAEIFTGVGAPSTGFRGDYRIVGHLHHFEAIPDGGQMKARISFDAKLIENSAQIIASRTFDIEVDAASDKPGDVVSAMDRAFSRMVDDMLPWSSRAIAQHLETDN